MYLIFVLTSIAVVAMAILPLIGTGQPRERVRPTRPEAVVSKPVAYQLHERVSRSAATMQSEVDDARPQAA